MSAVHCQRRDNHGPSCWLHLGGTCDCRCAACVGLRTADATPVLEMPIDGGIRRYVDILRAAGVETDQSCQGGPGHACAEPMVRFSGNAYEGFRAYAIAMTHGLPVLSVNHAWSVYEGCLHGPQWVMTFRTADPEITSGEPAAVRAEGMAPGA